MKKLIAAVLMINAISQGFAARDFSMHIPFDNVLVHNYEQLSAYKLPNEGNGKTIFCTLKAITDKHPEIPVFIQAVNFNINLNDSPSGGYNLVGAMTQYFIKYDVAPMDKNYNQTIRFINVSGMDNANFTVNCVYQ